MYMCIYIYISNHIHLYTHMHIYIYIGAYDTYDTYDTYTYITLENNETTQPRMWCCRFVRIGGHRQYARVKT